MAAMSGLNRFPVCMLLPVLLLAWVASAAQPRGLSRKGFFLSVSHRNESKAKPEDTRTDPAEEDKENAEEEESLKAPAGKTDGNETKGNESAKDCSKGNESKAEDAAPCDETKNETDAEAKAAWDEWYHKRSEAMWSKCEGMPACVKLCRWIRLALLVEYGDEKKAYKEMDKNDDGKVDSQEFVETCVAAGVTDDQISARGYAILYVIDINEDGFVSHRNFDKLIEVAKAGDEADAEAEFKEAAKTSTASPTGEKSTETKKTPEEEKADQLAKMKKELAAVKDEVHAHEHDESRDIGKEFKDMKEDHPAPVHHPAPARHAEHPAYETHIASQPSQSEDASSIEHEPQTQAEVKPEPPKSSCQRFSGSAASYAALAAFVVA